MTYVNPSAPWMPLGRITLNPYPYSCGMPSCPICYPSNQLSNWLYQTTTKPDTGPVVDFTAPSIDPYDYVADLSDDSYEQPMSNTERVTDLEEEVTNLRAAVLDLTKVVEYLLIWTGKKGNRQDRDKYLEGYIDPIRVIL